MTVPEEWRTTVAEWRASGLTAEQFGKARGLPKTRLWAWSSRVLRAERSASRPDDVQLVQVLRQGDRDDSRASVTVEFGDARVVVRPGVDRTTLTTVLDVLSSVRRAEAVGP